MPKRTLICTDCGEDYDFSEREQARFALQNYPDPIRCPPCRQAARARRRAARTGRPSTQKGGIDAR